MAGLYSDLCIAQLRNNEQTITGVLCHHVMVHKQLTLQLQATLVHQPAADSAPESWIDASFGHPVPEGVQLMSLSVPHSVEALSTLLQCLPLWSRELQVFVPLLVHWKRARVLEPCAGHEAK